MLNLFTLRVSAASEELRKQSQGKSIDTSHRLNQLGSQPTLSCAGNWHLMFACVQSSAGFSLVGGPTPPSPDFFEDPQQLLQIIYLFSNKVVSVPHFPSC